jgi:hypothetical protein
MQMAASNGRRRALQGIGLGLAAGAAGVLGARPAPAAEGSLIPQGAGTLHALLAQLAKAPRRRDFKTIPMILNDPAQWDHEALTAVIGYKGSPKQVWDNTAIASPWLNLMRNAMNAEVWSFKHPDFLCVSATHGTAQLALYDQPAWDKYQLAKLAGDKFPSNTLLAEPAASRKDPADYEAADGVFSPADNSIAVLQRRGAVFTACHNAIWELAEHLLATNVNPDHLSQEQLAADLTNHVVPSVIVTPGAVATLVELQHAGFTYGK